MQINWTEIVAKNTTSADRCGDDDVVRVALARELAARLEECQRDRQRIIEMIGECCRATATLSNAESADPLPTKPLCHEK